MNGEFMEAGNNTFGGIICMSDYDTYHSSGNIASRIASDMKFDMRCKQDCDNRDRQAMKEREEM